MRLWNHDDDVVRKAGTGDHPPLLSKQLRVCSGIATKETADRSRAIMEEAKLDPDVGEPSFPPLKKPLNGESSAARVNRIVCAAALELPTGEIVTGCNSPLLHASSALILNAVKVLAGIDHEIDLIPPAIVQSVTAMKRDVLKGRGVSLNLDETLICLAMSRAINEDARKASEELPKLMGCEVHMTHIPSSGDSSGLRKLLLNVTSDPRFPSSNLYNPA